MPTSKVSRDEGARYGGLDGSAGSFPAQLRALAIGYLFFPHYRYGLVFGVGATFGDLPPEADLAERQFQGINRAIALSPPPQFQARAPTADARRSRPEFGV